MKILITGGAGMLGGALCSLISSKKGVACRSFSRSIVDISSPDLASFIVCFHPTHIIHCAAIARVDYCEANPIECEKINVTSTLAIVEAANMCKAQIVYPQSFLVYGNSDIPQDELSVLDPQSVYARSKLAAENLILENSTVDPLIIRLGGFFGGLEKDKNFVGHFARILLNKKDDVVSREFPVGSRIWQPTYIGDIAENIFLLLINNISGTWNLASHGHTSFFELAKKLVFYLGMQESVSILKADDRLVSAAEKAYRPMSIVMSTEKLTKSGFDLQRPWEEPLKEYIDLYRSFC